MDKITEQECTGANFAQAMKAALGAAAMTGHPLDLTETAETAGKIFDGVIEGLKKAGYLKFD